jgi:hypothetical protein
VSWRILFSGLTVVIGGAIGVTLALASINVALWVAAFATLVLSFILVFDRHHDYPVLIWVVGFNWVGIVAPVLAADLTGIPLSYATLGPYREQAVNLNLVALIVFAFGIAISIRIGGGLEAVDRRRDPPQAVPAVTVQTGVIAYFVVLGVAEFGSYIVSNIPQLQQPTIVLHLAKFIFVYLVAAAAFTEGRGYSWLVVILAVEVVSGLTGFFGTFKEAFFLVLIALVAVGRRPSPRMWAFGLAAAALVLFLSVLWTAVKPEYRRWVSGYSGEQIVVRSFEERLGWMADHMIERDFDYWRSFNDMINRIDNTFVFAQFLAQEDNGNVPELPGRYLGGIEHVLMPRILFPGKETIDDSAVTTALTGRVIDKNTSISIGFIAEAYYDFGPGWMFVPVLLIGMTVGAAGRYFMTRKAPYLIRQAFTATALFNFFQFGTNFNKALGTFLIGFLVFALLLKFAYPYAALWLAGRGSLPSGKAVTAGVR